MKLFIKKSITSFILLCPFGAYTETKTWAASVSGNGWSDSSHWSPTGIPGHQDTAVFNTVAHARRPEFMVTLIGPASVGSIEFHNANSLTGYLIYGERPLELTSPLTNTNIIIGPTNEGFVNFDVPILIGNDLYIQHQSSSKMVFAKSILGSNKNITILSPKKDTGHIEFTGSTHNTFSGTMHVQGGNILFNKKPGISATTGNLYIDFGTVEYLNHRQLNSKAEIHLEGKNGDAILHIGPYQEIIESLSFSPSSFLNTVQLEETGILTIEKDSKDALFLADNSTIEGSGTIVFSSTNGGVTYIGNEKPANILANLDFQNQNRIIETTPENMQASLHISGNILNGSITKSGSGTLILTGKNSFDTNLSILEGTLQGTTSSISTSVKNEGTLVFDQNFDGTFSHTIDGSGNLIKSGQGTLVLTNTHTFTGGIEIKGGNLEGNSRTLTGPVLNNGSLIFNEDFDGIFHQNIEGNGSLVKQGSGNLLLTGNNPFHGDILVLKGSLQGTTKSLQGTIINQASVILKQDFDDVYASTIHGNGSLIKSGSNTLIFDKNNTHSGQIFLTEGAIQIRHNEGLGGSVLKMHDQTTLKLAPYIAIFNPIEAEGNAVFVDVSSHISQIGGDLSGNHVIKTGAGILECSGNNHINHLEVKNGGIGINGSFIIDEKLQTEPNTTLFGNGEIKGNIVIGGILTSGIIIPRENLNNEALEEIQTYFDFEKPFEETIPLSDHFFLATPYSKNSVDELHIDGNVLLTPESMLAIQFDPDSTNTLHVNGTLSLNSATLKLIPSKGFYHLNQSYKIIDAQKIDGEFGQILNTFPLLLPSLNYSQMGTDFSVSFQLTQKYFSDLFSEGNAGQMAKILDRFAKSPCQNSPHIIEALINTQTEHEIQDALNQMHPSLFTALPIIQQNDLLYVKNAVFSHLKKGINPCQAFEQEKKRPVTPLKNSSKEEIIFDLDLERKSKIQLWFGAIGGYTKQSNQDEEPGYLAKTPGAILGLDTEIGNKGIIGGSIGYLYTDNQWKKERGHADTQNLYGTIYGQYVGSRGYFITNLSGGYSFYRTDRSIKFGPHQFIQAHAHGSFEGYEGAADIEFGLHVPFKSYVFCPFISMDYVIVHLNSFNETNARSLNLQLKSHLADLLNTESGIEFTFCQKKDQTLLSAKLRCSAILETRFFGNTEEGQFICGGDFSVKGFYPNRWLAGLGGGIVSQFGKNTLSLEYLAKLGDKFSDQSLLFEYAWKF